MFTDIVFPQGNEEDFIRIAKRLSIQSLCFVYNYDKKDNLKLRKEKIAVLQKSSEIKLFFGLVAKNAETRAARTQADMILVRSTPDNRLTFEKREVDGVFGLEDNPKRDSMHYRYSSLNQVLCTIASKNRTIIAFPFRMCLRAEPERRAVLFGRIMQNIRLCRKYKVPMALASFATEPYEMRCPSDLASLGLVLRMTPGQSKDSINSISKRIDENKRIMDGTFIAEGIEILS
jgi:RNase P/RNase MRP subunit p30